MGTGLGLSTTLAIVKSHGGFINAWTVKWGKGRRSGYTSRRQERLQVLPAASEEADLPMGNGELILIIDDEAAIREITKETLQAHGYKAMTASDGAEGIAVFAENKGSIKVVITDIMMPVMDGTAAILALKRISPDVKIIAASGLDCQGANQNSARSNVQAFLTKPYTAEKLLKPWQRRWPNRLTIVHRQSTIVNRSGSDSPQSLSIFETSKLKKHLTLRSPFISP
jgi:two-component system cell cycle sensor histidine kinase/response regulator CckA